MFSTVAVIFLTLDCLVSFIWTWSSHVGLAVIGECDKKEHDFSVHWAKVET